MSISAKTTYHHGDLRQSLINAAIELIREEGMSELSLRQVARRVGVSHNAPYRHFEDKDALLAAVAEQGFQSLQAAMETAKQGLPADSPQGLEAIGIAYVNFALAFPFHYRLMFVNVHCHPDKYPALAAASRQAFMVLVNTIQAGQANGVLRAANPLDMARVAWSLVHGQALLALDNMFQIHSETEFNTFLKFSTQMLIQGLASRDQG